MQCSPKSAATRSSRGTVRDHHKMGGCTHFTAADWSKNQLLTAITITLNLPHMRMLATTCTLLSPFRRYSSINGMSITRCSRAFLDYKAALQQAATRHRQEQDAALRFGELHPTVQLHQKEMVSGQAVSKCLCFRCIMSQHADACIMLVATEPTILCVYEDPVSLRSTPI